MSTTTLDEIKKTLSIKAPIERVWALLNSKQGICEWFCQEIEGDFAPGSEAVMVFHGSDGQIYRANILVEVLEDYHMRYRWAPHLMGSDTLNLAEATTVNFWLEKNDEGTQLKVVESGFSLIPEDKRDESFRGNSSGWDQELGELVQEAEK